jgi:hypothetical protein
MKIPAKAIVSRSQPRMTSLSEANIDSWLVLRGLLVNLDKCLGWQLEFLCLIAVYLTTVCSSY